MSSILANLKGKGRGFALCSALPTEVLAKVGALRPEQSAPAQCDYYCPQHEETICVGN